MLFAQSVASCYNGAVLAGRIAFHVKQHSNGSDQLFRTVYSCPGQPERGVGKTATAVNLAGELASRGQQVLLVDCDPRRNTGPGVTKRDLHFSTYEVLVGIVGRNRIDLLNWS